MYYNVSDFVALAGSSVQIRPGVPRSGDQRGLHRCELNKRCDSCRL